MSEKAPRLGLRAIPFEILRGGRMKKGKNMCGGVCKKIKYVGGFRKIIKICGWGVAREKYEGGSLGKRVGFRKFCATEGRGFTVPSWQGYTIFGLPSPPRAVIRASDEVLSIFDMLFSNFCYQGALKMTEGVPLHPSLPQTPRIFKKSRGPRH